MIRSLSQVSHTANGPRTSKYWTGCRPNSNNWFIARIEKQAASWRPAITLWHSQPFFEHKPNGHWTLDRRGTPPFVTSGYVDGQMPRCCLRALPQLTHALDTALKLRRRSTDAIRFGSSRGNRHFSERHSRESDCLKRNREILQLLRKGLRSRHHLRESLQERSQAEESDAKTDPTSTSI
jgi:hypothetical protein